MCDRFKITEKPDGNREWHLVYCGAEPQMWAMSLFSMLLTCFTMERTLYTDYESRLRFDHELLRMRAKFERFKEQVRRILIARYNVQPPRPKSAVQGP
jgi:hypothetical protein